MDPVEGDVSDRESRSVELDLVVPDQLNADDLKHGTALVVADGSGQSKGEPLRSAAV